MSVVVGALVVVVVLQSLLVFGLLRSHAEILRRLHAVDGGETTSAAAVPVELRTAPGVPRPGTGDGRAHDIAGAGLRDDVVLVGVGGVAHRTLLAFLSANCLTCETFWQDFATPGVDLGLGSTRLVIVTHGPDFDSVSRIRELAPQAVPLVMSNDAWHDYAVPGSPYFVLVDGVTRRVIGEGTGARWDQVRGLLDQSLADASDPSTEARIDRELLAAGIGPDDPSLYHGDDTERGR